MSPNLCRGKSGSTPVSCQAFTSWFLLVCLSVLRQSLFCIAWVFFFLQFAKYRDDWHQPAFLFVNRGFCFARTRARVYMCTHLFHLSLQEGKGRPVTSHKAVTCAELVLDVSPKTQRVILKKKVKAQRLATRVGGSGSSSPKSLTLQEVGREPWRLWACAPTVFTVIMLAAGFQPSHSQVLLERG